MRYAIFSDIHSNLEALEKVLAALKKEKPDKYLCAGDIVGYGANPKECLEIIRDLGCPVVCGNHDWAVCGSLDYSYFNHDARAAVEWTRGILGQPEKDYLRKLGTVYNEGKVTMVHGSLDDPGSFEYIAGEASAVKTLALCKTKYCFVGHTHVPLEFARRGKTLVNVGSVGQPRDGDPRAAYCIFDGDSGKAIIKRVDYDIRSAMKKIVSAGLPGFLAARLAEGA